MTLRVRWLGRVPYREALAVQTAIFTYGVDDHLLLLEHPHVFTHGPRADLAANVLVEPASVGAELVSVKRGGDVTYHGPGQLVGYPIVNVSNSVGAADHVGAIQDAGHHVRDRRSGHRLVGRPSHRLADAHGAGHGQPRRHHAKQHTGQE